MPTNLTACCAERSLSLAGLQIQKLPTDPLPRRRGLQIEAQRLQLAEALESTDYPVDLDESLGKTGVRG